MKKLVSALLATSAILMTASPVMAANPNTGAEGNTGALDGKSTVKVVGQGDTDPGTHVPVLPGKFTFAQAPDLDFGTINLNTVQQASVTNQLVKHTNGLVVNDQRPTAAQLKKSQDWFTAHPLVGTGDNAYVLAVTGDNYVDANGNAIPVGGKVTVKESDYKASQTAWGAVTAADTVKGYTISANSQDLKNGTQALHASSLKINGQETLNATNVIVTVSDATAASLQGSPWDFFYGVTKGETNTDQNVGTIDATATAYNNGAPSLTVKTSGLKSGNYEGVVTYSINRTL